MFASAWPSPARSTDPFARPLRTVGEVIDMRFDAIFATSAPVRTDDLDWEAAGRAGLTDGELFALSYFADVEGQTVFYLRDLLTSGLADDPDVLRFLTV